MLRFSIVRALRTKPISQGYVTQFIQPPIGRTETLNRDAESSNFELQALRTPTAERYDAWFKETYGVEEVSDHPNTNSLSSERNLQRLDEFDDKEAIRELEYWSKTFYKHEALK